MSSHHSSESKASDRMDGGLDALDKMTAHFSDQEAERIRSALDTLPVDERSDILHSMDQMRPKQRYQLMRNLQYITRAQTPVLTDRPPPSMPAPRPQVSGGASGHHLSSPVPVPETVVLDDAPVDTDSIYRHQVDQGTEWIDINGRKFEVKKRTPEQQRAAQDFPRVDGMAGYGDAPYGEALDGTIIGGIGLAMTFADLRPTSIRESTRAYLFPKQYTKITNTVYETMKTLALNQLYEMESPFMNNTTCTGDDIRIDYASYLRPETAESQPSYFTRHRHELDIEERRARIVTWIDGKENNRWREEMLANSDDQWLGSELWHVDRCGTPRTWKVHYWAENGGDGWGVDLEPSSPTDVVGWMEYAFYKFKRYFMLIG